MLIIFFYTCLEIYELLVALLEYFSIDDDFVLKNIDLGMLDEILAAKLEIRIKF